jgi:hypothetical protein
MTSVWSSEQILALAPDAGSIKNGKALVTASKWQNLGGTDRAIWGECQGYDLKISNPLKRRSHHGLQY